MSDFFGTIMQWAGGLSIVGLIGFVLLAIFAPGVISVLSSWLTALSPLVKGAADGLVWFVKTIWEGFKDMTDNAASIVFVIVAILIGGWWFSTLRKPPEANCETCITNLRKDYKFVPRQKKFDPFGLVEADPLPLPPPIAPLKAQLSKPKPKPVVKKTTPPPPPAVSSEPVVVWKFGWPPGTYHYTAPPKH